jgi:hypothetical protein
MVFLKKRSGSVLKLWGDVFSGLLVQHVNPDEFISVFSNAE